MADATGDAVKKLLLDCIFGHTDFMGILGKDHFLGGSLTADDLVGTGLLQCDDTDQIFADLLIAGQGCIDVLNHFGNSLPDIGDAMKRHVFGVGVDFCNDGASLAIHEAFFHHLMIQKQIFDLFGRYIFAVAQNDQILFAAGDMQESFFVRITNIAGTQPSVFGDHLCGQFRRIDISHHNGGTADLQFSVHHTGLDTGDNAAGGVGLVRSGHIGGGNGGGMFAHAVTLAEENANLVILFYELCGQVRTAGDDSIHAVAEHTVLDLINGFALLLGEHHHFGIERLSDHGNGGEASGIEPQNIFAQLSHTAIDAQGIGAGKAHQNVRIQTENMVHGQNADFCGVFSVVGAEKSVHQILIGQHDALFFTTGAGGENNGGTSLLVNSVHRLLAHISRKDTAAGFGEFAFGHLHGVSKGVAAGKDIIDTQHQLGFPHQNICFCLVQAGTDRIFFCLRIKQYRNTAAGHDAQHHSDIHGSIGADHTDSYGMPQFLALLVSPYGDRITFYGKLSVGGFVNGAILQGANKTVVFKDSSGFLDKILYCSDVFISHHNISPRFCKLEILSCKLLLSTVFQVCHNTNGTAHIDSAAAQTGAVQ